MVKRCHVFRFHKIFSFFGPEKKRREERRNKWSIGMFHSRNAPAGKLFLGRNPPRRSFLPPHRWWSVRLVTWLFPPPPWTRLLAAPNRLFPELISVNSFPENSRSFWIVWIVVGLQQKLMRRHDRLLFRNEWNLYRNRPMNGSLKHNALWQ